MDFARFIKEEEEQLVVELFRKGKQESNDGDVVIISCF